MIIFFFFGVPRISGETSANPARFNGPIWTRLGADLENSGDLLQNWVDFMGFHQEKIGDLLVGDV